MTLIFLFIRYIMAETVSTGDPVLDDILVGGFPKNRTVLLVGGPGTGKSTLAMQYLQAGLDRDENCLFITTEQTTAELKDSFAPYDFELDHPGLTTLSIHATPGYTIESHDEEVMLLDALEEEKASADADCLVVTGDGATDVEDGAFGGGGAAGQAVDGFNVPFSTQYIGEVLQRYAPADRVVFDSISGLAPMANDDHRFRRAVLDLIQLFTSHFGATSVFTAEEIAGGSPTVGSGATLQFNTHGVISLTREQVDGDYHRFVRVQKMRGMDHETKAFEMEFDAEGVHVVPTDRQRSDTLGRHEFLGTGINGLDQLCGGGVIQGSTSLLEHDGRASVEPLVTNTITEALRSDHAIVLLPPSGLTPDRLESMIAERVAPLSQLFAEDQLFVLDLVGGWDAYDRNVFTIKDYEQFVRNLLGDLKLLLSWKMKRIFATMNDRRGDQPALAVVFTEAMLQEFRPAEVRQMYYWARKNLFMPDDTVLFVQNPGVMEETLAEFFVYDAQQMLRTWIHDNGLQYLKLEKSPVGHLGSTQMVEHVDYPPYVRVQRPRGSRSSPNGVR